MQRETEFWRKLSEQATDEQDPNRLIEILEEVNAILQAREERLREQRAA